jgi:hypothetical protein
MALGKVYPDPKNADYNEQAIEQKSQEYFMPEFKVHPSLTPTLPSPHEGDGTLNKGEIYSRQIS